MISLIHRTELHACFIHDSTTLGHDSTLLVFTHNKVCIVNLWTETLELLLFLARFGHYICRPLHVLLAHWYYLDFSWHRLLIDFDFIGYFLIKVRKVLEHFSYVALTGRDLPGESVIEAGTVKHRMGHHRAERGGAFIGRGETRGMRGRTVHGERCHYTIAWMACGLDVG